MTTHEQLRSLTKNELVGYIEAMAYYLPTEEMHTPRHFALTVRLRAVDAELKKHFETMDELSKQRADGKISNLDYLIEFHKQYEKYESLSKKREKIDRELWPREGSQETHV